jgi:hypothetical protein
MAQFLRPCVAMGQWSPSNMGYSGAQSYVAHRNQEFARTSRTPYIRVWASWPLLQPSPGVDPAVTNSPYPDNFWPGMNPQLYIWMLDETIRRIRTDGRRVILTLRDCPEWANPTNRRRGVVEYPDTRPFGDRDVWSVPPDNVENGGPWSIMVWWLCNRYNIFNAAARGDDYWIDFFEVCNEPNFEWKPQTDKDGTRQLYRWAAKMIKTAREVTRDATRNYPPIMGPALSDTEVRTSPNQTHWKDFMTAVLNRLDQLGFQEDGYVAWTHHNYTDVEADLSGALHSPPQSGDNRAAQVRELLRQRGWVGWGQGASQPPYVLITEGGCKLSAPEIQAYPEHQRLDAQRARVDRAWRRMQGGPGTIGAGIGMFTNYLFWSDPNDTGNSGLCNPWFGSDYPTPAAERPVFHTWKNLPTTMGRD